MPVHRLHLRLDKHGTMKTIVLCMSVYSLIYVSYNVVKCSIKGYDLSHM